MSNAKNFVGTESFEFAHGKKIYCSPRVIAIDVLKTETMKDGPYIDGVIWASTSNPG